MNECEHTLVAMIKKSCNLSTYLIIFALITLSCSCLAGNINEAENQISVVIETPQQAIDALKSGNLRFVVDSVKQPNSRHKRVAETALKQNPFAAIVGCSDSRVPVELIFDQGIGDIFVVRTAGNSVNDDIIMGSIDYAACHLDVKLIVVLGHTSCGGITAAITPSNHGDEHSEDDGKVGALISSLQADVKEFVGNPEKINEAISANVQSQVAKLTSNPALASRIASGYIKVVSAIYDVHTGKVEFTN